MNDVKFLVDWEANNYINEWWVFYSISLSNKYLNKVKDSLTNLMNKYWKEHWETIWIESIWDDFNNKTFIEANQYDYENFLNWIKLKKQARVDHLEWKLDKLKVKNAVVLEIANLKRQINEVEWWTCDLMNEYIFKKVWTTYEDFTTRYWYFFVYTNNFQWLFEKIKNHWLFKVVLRNDKKRILCKLSIGWFVIFIHFWSKESFRDMKKQIKEDIYDKWKNSIFLRRKKLYRKWSFWETDMKHFKRTQWAKETFDFMKEETKEIVETKAKKYTWEEIIWVQWWIINTDWYWEMSEWDRLMIEEFNKTFYTKTKSWNLKKKKTIKRKAWNKEIQKWNDSLIFTFS